MAPSGGGAPTPTLCLRFLFSLSSFRHPFSEYLFAATLKVRARTLDLEARHEFGRLPSSRRGHDAFTPFPRAPFERSPISSGDARSLAASAPPRALLCVGSQWDCPLPCISLVEVCWRQSIRFSLSRNVFISRGLSKDVFARPRNLSWSLFSFSAVETPLHRL